MIIKSKRETTFKVAVKSKERCGIVWQLLCDLIDVAAILQGHRKHWVAL